MRILIWGMSNTFGGVEAFIYNSILAIKKANDSIIIDCIGYDQSDVKKLILSYDGKYIAIDNLPKRQIDNFFYEHSKEYDVFWYNCVDLSHVQIIRAAYRCNMRRIIIHSHSSSIMVSGVLRRKYHLFRHYIHRKYAYKIANDFWSCSDAAAKWMFPRKALYRVKFISNAIKAELFRYDKYKRKTIRSMMNWNDLKVVALIGRISEEKDPFFAIDILQNLLLKASNYRLVFIGDGPIKSDVEQYAESQKVAYNVEFLGRRDDVAELLQGIDIVLMTSKFEGFPMTVVEAQASGTPVFVPIEAVTEQAKIVDDCFFLKKCDGPQKWANTISNYPITKKDNFDQLCENGYDISTAGIKLISLLSA